MTLLTAFRIGAVAIAASLLIGCGSARSAPSGPAPEHAKSSAPPLDQPAALADPSALPGPTRPANLQPYRDLLAAADRSSDDRALDAGRHPAEMLGFFDVRRGTRVAELGAGGGYTTELLARAVGDTGAVYGQNSRFLLERFAEKPWSTRLAKPLMRRVVRLDREFDEPFPPDLKDLDAVLIVLFYHDTVWLGTDRDRMNRAVFAALRPGGVYGIVDHSGRAGSGTAETQSLHRIEEIIVREEVKRAGFQLAAQSDFLRNPGDTRDWNASPTAAAERRGSSDRFVLKFVKPAKSAAPLVE
jgi:predicted methyltransferase